MLLIKLNMRNVIFVKIVEAQVEVDDGKDLESDVHEDRVDNA